MSVLLFAGLVIAVLVALDYAALRWGVDSRAGYTDEFERPGILSVR